MAQRSTEIKFRGTLAFADVKAAQRLVEVTQWRRTATEHNTRAGFCSATSSALHRQLTQHNTTQHNIHISYVKSSSGILTILHIKTQHHCRQSNVNRPSTTSTSRIPHYRNNGSTSFKNQIQHLLSPSINTGSRKEEEP